MPNTYVVISSMHLLWVLFSFLKGSPFTYSNCIHLRVSSLCLLMQQHSLWEMNVIGNIYKSTVGKGARGKRGKASVSGKGIFYVPELQKSIRYGVVLLHHLKKYHKMCYSFKESKAFRYLIHGLAFSKSEAGACSASDFLSTMRENELQFLITCWQ